MGLSRYAAEAGGIGDEILEWMTEEDRARIPLALKTFGMDYFLNPPLDAMEEAAKFLGKAPSQQEKMFKKKDFPQAMRMIILAAAMAKLSCDAMRFAESLQYNISGGYRVVAERVARSAINMDLTLSSRVASVLRNLQSRTSHIDED